MKRALFLLAMIAVILPSNVSAGEVTAAVGPQDALVGDEEALRWCGTYYIHHESDLTVPVIRSLVKQGAFDKATGRAPLMVFLGEVFRENPEKLSPWMDALADISEENHKLLWSALWYADSEAARSLLELADDNASPDGKAFLANLKSTPPDPLVSPVASPANLDMLWAKFLATGDRRCVQRIIEVLPWSDEGIRREEGADRVDIGNFLIGQAARWSLTSNAVQHDRVLEICKEELARQPEEVKAVLRQVINEVLRDRLAKRTN